MSKSKEATLEKWAETLVALSEVLARAGMEETVKWGGPVYTFNGKNIVGTAAFKDYVGLWFFNGGLLTDKAAKLQDAGSESAATKSMRQWRFSSTASVLEHTDLILSYVAEAIENSTRGLVVKPAPKPGIESALLNQTLSENAALQQAFGALSPSKQREYAEHIESAKREVTRQERLRKIVPMILEGKGLHDKYKK